MRVGGRHSFPGPPWLLLPLLAELSRGVCRAGRLLPGPAHGMALTLPTRLRPLLGSGYDAEAFVYRARGDLVKRWSGPHGAGALGGEASH